VEEGREGSEGPFPAGNCRTDFGDRNFAGVLASPAGCFSKQDWDREGGIIDEMPDSSPPRYLGLDVGNRRIGVAVSDELGLTAQPVLTLERRRNRREDLRSLARLCRRFGVIGIVVGNPLHASGEASPQGAKIQALAAELGELTGLPIYPWDERLTTREAHQILYEAGHERQTHRRIVDQVAATLILQSFLDREPASRS
jgi:putative Holliday junction resolvase